MALNDLQTELGAVNEMLRGISTSQVDRLDGDDVPIDAASALDTLRSTSRSLQDSAEEWWFNTETFDLKPDAVTGTVAIPLNTLKMFPWDTRYVRRGDKVYDTVDHTFVIGCAVKATLRLLLPFEQMPNVAREYVARKAKRVFQVDEQGEEAVSGRPNEDELRAYAALLNDNAEALQANVTADWRGVRQGFGYGYYGGLRYSGSST